MEPSAKININRKDNGDWILCPSKSIPGKFYYFNVRTGEAVWYQSETENTVPKNDKETNENNEYLKPVSPRKENPTTSNVCFPSNVTFPKYISNVPNITWTIQLPMCVANMSEVTKRTLDQNTQTPEPYRETFVQTSATSLSQRFTRFENTNTSMTLNTNINKDDNCVNGLRFRSSTPMKNWWNREIINSTNKTDETLDSMIKRKNDDLKFVLKEPHLKRIRIFPDRHCKDQLSFSNNLNSPFYSTENTNLNGQYKVENAITNPAADNQGLDQSDLRILLQMKRQRSIDICMKYNENKKRENSLMKETPKKRVTFHLDNNNEYYSLDVVDANKEVKTPTPIKSLKSFNKDDNEIWFICVDEDILINDFNFIKDYINEDDLCKLLIPDTMVKYIESLGRGEHGGRDRVMFARQVYRHLVTSRQVQIVETVDGSSLMDDIVKCCLQVMDEDIQIVLITKNLELENVAKMFGIDVYSLDDIKNDLTNPNARGSTGNNTKYNIFLQNINDFDPFVLSKSINPEKRLKDTQFIYSMNLTNQTNGHVNKDDLYNCKYAFDIHNKNSENNPTDVCKRIEKLKLIDEKSTNLRKVINNSIYINNEIEHSRNDNSNTNRQTDSYYTTLDNEEDDKNKYRIEINQRNRNYLSKLTLNSKDNKDLHKKSMSIDNGKDLKIYNPPVVSIDNFGDEQNLIDDEDIKNNIIVRYDEWICCYVQIMEEFVHSILQIHFNYENGMPYFLNESLDLLKGIFSSSRTIRTVIEKLLAFNGLFTIKDINKTHADPNDFMKMVECGFLLVEGFKNILSEDFSDIEDLLVKLLESIENSNYVEELETVETPLRRSDEDTCVIRCNFVKKRSDIIDYLKKHFVEWKNYVEVDQETTQYELNPHIKIFRTSGRDLNTFKIDNDKRISYENPRDKIKSHEDGIDKFNKQSDIETPLHMPIPHGNTFGDSNEKNGPKVIRNIKLIDEFEEKVNKATHLDQDALDYSEINTLSSASGTYKDFNKNNDSGTLDNLNDFDMTDINESLSIINDARNDSTVDSGFGNEVHACSLIKSFLIELSSTFKSIYSFVDKCIKEFQCDELSDETKNELVNKANRTHTHIADVIEKLKSIIERESADSTLKTVIIKAGNDVIEDKRITRYRQTVTKCLEQAQVLESSLKIMMNITNEDCDVSLSSKNDITHFNIFE